MNHHPTFYVAKAVRWVSCSCGWKSSELRLAVFVQLEFGEHLLEAAGSR